MPTRNHDAIASIHDGIAVNSFSPNDARRQFMERSEKS